MALAPPGRSHAGRPTFPRNYLLTLLPSLHHRRKSGAAGGESMVADPGLIHPRARHTTGFSATLVVGKTRHGRLLADAKVPKVVVDHLTRSNRRLPRRSTPEPTPSPLNSIVRTLGGGTEGSNPACSSGESVSLPERLSRVENLGFPRGCAPLAWQLGRQRRAGCYKIAPIGGNISVAPYSSTAVPLMGPARRPRRSQ